MHKSLPSKKIIFLECRNNYLARTHYNVPYERRKGAAAATKQLVLALYNAIRQ